MVKYGANLILATQSLGYLETLDEQHDRALRAAVFANLDGLLVFQCSGEDAEYLVRELGGDVDSKDLLDLPEHCCYAKLSARGQRLPVFSLRLDPPPPPDELLAHRLALQSGRRYGRDVEDLHRDTAALYARIALLRAGGRPLGGADDAGAAAGDAAPLATSATSASPVVESHATDAAHGAPGVAGRRRGVSARS
jgi:hypothetical protein